MSPVRPGGIESSSGTAPLRYACRYACLAVLLTLLALLPTRAVFADWTITYSSATNPVTVVDAVNNQTWHKDYTGSAPNPYGGGALSGTPDTPGPSATGPGSVTCAGQITATVTWDGGATSAPLPPAVVLQEHATASWSGDVGSGSCHGGLPSTPSASVSGRSPVTGTSTGGGSSDPGGSDDQTQYTVIANPPSSFTVTVSPDATATQSSTGTPSPPRHTQNQIGASAYVSYSLNVTSIQITFAAPVLGSPGSYKCLVGQQVTASLSITPDPDSVQWNESGGEPFSAYTTSEFSGTVALIGDAVYVTDPPPFHFRRDETATFTCAGTTHGLPFSVEASLDIVRPSASMEATQGKTRRDNTVIGLLKDLASTTSQFSGIRTTSKVTIPSDYASEGPGTIYHTQLAVPNRTYGGNATRPDDPTVQNGINPPVLDGQKKYPDQSGNSEENTGVDLITNDTPTADLDTADGYTKTTVSDESYITYLMFVPPGPGSLAVPLKRFTWKWGGVLTYNPNATVAADLYTVTQPTQSLTPSVDCYEHPTWNDNTAHNHF